MNTSTSLCHTLSALWKSAVLAALSLVIVTLSCTTASAQMIAQYSFEGDVLDTGGSGLNGVNHGVTFAAGIIGVQAGVFNGSTTYVDLNNASATGPLKPVLPVTISAWIYLNTLTGTQRIFSGDNSDNSSTILGYDLSVVGGVLTCEFGDGLGSGTSHVQAKSGNSTLTTGQWYHVAAVIQGASNMHLYVNGVDDGGTYSGAGGTMMYSAISSKIGTSGTTFFFNGMIDAVQVYNTALSDTQIALLSYAGVGVWPCGEGTGTTTADATGNAPAATLINSPVWTTGQVGHALTFDGATTYINLNNASASSPLKPKLPITVAAWVKLGSISGVQRIVSGDNTDNSTVIAGYDLATVSGQLECEYADAGGAFVTHRRSKVGTTVMTTGKWYYVAAVIQGPTTMNLYINGADDGGTYSGSGGAIGYTSATTKIGTSGTGSFFNGTLEDVSIYNYAFSATAIAQLYSAQPTAPNLPTSFSDNFDTDTIGAAPSSFAAVSNVNTAGGGVNSWAVAAGTGTNQVYHAAMTNAPGNGNGAATSIRGVPYTGGGLTRNFTYTSTIKVDSGATQYSIGLVSLSGAQSDLAGNYYYTGVDQAGNVFIQSSNGGTSGLTLGTATPLSGGLVVGTTYSFTLTGTYTSGSLALALAVTDGTHTGSQTATAATPLTGNDFGYECKVPTAGGGVAIDIDNFNVAVHFGTWTPMFDDEFTGTALNPALWTAGYRWGDVVNNELEAMRPENVTVANGVCTIKAEQRSAFNEDMFGAVDGGTPQSYASGCLTTYTKYTQAYGYFEARIKMPTSVGCWPAFWMLPDRGTGINPITGVAYTSDQRLAVGTTVDKTSMPMGNEFDTVEYQSVWENPATGNSTSHAGYIWNPAPPSGTVGNNGAFVHPFDGTGKANYTLSQPDGQFHTYGIHWAPGSVVVYIDGQVVQYAASLTNVSVVPEYILLNCAMTQQNWLGGATPTLDQINAALPGTMQIDYVRSWSESAP